VERFDDSAESGRAWSVGLAPALDVGLTDDVVEVWTVPLDVDGARLRTLAGVLSRHERARAARLRRRQDRERFVVAHGALREILGRYLRQAPAALRFRAGRHGRPELVARGRPPLHHSLSRSAGVALCAIRTAGPVGIDVERIRPEFDWRGIAERFFAAGERRSLAGATDEAFFACWTRKEAVLKARGTGLLAPLDAVEVPLEAARPGALVAAGVGAPPCWLRDCAPAPGYAAAVAGEGAVPRLLRRRWVP
jgi:4'-phosphopantetheinyl transferase